MDRNFRSRHNEAMAEISAKGRKQARLAEADQHIAAAESLIARQLPLLPNSSATGTQARRCAPCWRPCAKVCSKCRHTATSSRPNPMGRL